MTLAPIYVLYDNVQLYIIIANNIDVVVIIISYSLSCAATYYGYVLGIL